MEVELKNSQGESAGTLELEDSIWNRKMNGAVLHQVVVAQQANKRLGGHDTKDRGDVIASGRKLRIQKHTGRARQGDRTSPLHRGGAVAHGPHPRSYRMRVPKRVRRLALKIALSEQLRRGNITFLNELSQAAPSTRGLAGILSAIQAAGSAILVTAGDNTVIRKSASNLPGVSVQTADLINPLEIYGARRLVFSRAAAERVNELWASDARIARPAGLEA